MSNKTNYSKMSTAAPVEEIENEVVETVEEPIETPVVEEIKTKTGVVIDCARLNVRKAPKADAKILKTISRGDTVIIHDEVGEFYKIGNPNATEYCMKKYISVNE